MRLMDLRPGDEVKNRRSGAWGRVVRLDVDMVTGEVVRVRVRPRLGIGFQHEARWWPASGISMAEVKR